MSGAVQARFPDGRLHLQHGPIDLVIEARGAPEEVEAAYAQAARRFDGVLEALVDELPLLRTAVGGEFPIVRGPVARRMVAAVWPHRAVFITPMAAVAGAVADEILAALLAGRRLASAYVNNGGDIAVHVAPDEHLRAGIVENPAAHAIGAAVDAAVRLERPCGLATSGWRGRSHSLGIADAATVLACNAAQADAAATMVANAVDADHPAIRRAPARSLKEDSDLGGLPVTVRVDPLPLRTVDAALDSGLRMASALRARGLLEAAYLALQGRTRALTSQPSTKGASPCPSLAAIP